MQSTLFTLGRYVYRACSGTFYYLCSILDVCSRCIVNWDLREPDIEIILLGA